ncbi:MogA/MoaB family molybdenum cofactor biosynthesis protein [Leucobacter sp. GX24907]
MSRHAVIIVASTSAAAGAAEDATGPIIQSWLEDRAFVCAAPVVVADGPGVGEALRSGLRSGPDVVLTTGGTGVSPSDGTPEHTAQLLELELPGIPEELRRRGLEHTPFSLLTRGVAGFAGRSFIMNLPGSPGGVRDGLAVLDPLLDHLLEQRSGGDAVSADRSAHT